MIAVAGEALVDLIVRADGAIDARPGGGPFNAARTIARLGRPVTFLGRLSGDRFGRVLRAALAEDGVAVGGEHTEDPTTLALAEVDGAGVASYRFYLDGTSAPGVAELTLPAGVSALHVGSLGLAVKPMADAHERLVTTAPEDVLVFVDPNCRPAVGVDRERLRRVFARADVVKVSEEDLAVLGVAASDIAGPAVVLLTRGSDPALVHVGGSVLEVPVPAVEVADTVGAGDAFGGGFLACWAANGGTRADLGDRGAVAAAAAVAVTVSARTCERPGADPPRLADLDPVTRAALRG